MAVAVYSRVALRADEQDALWRSMGTVASVLCAPMQEEATPADAFNGSGRLTVSDDDDVGPFRNQPTTIDESTTYVATLRVGRTLTSTGRGESHVIAVARAAAGSLEMQPKVRFAGDVGVGGTTVTIVLLEVEMETAGTASKSLRLGLSVRPAGDINGAAAAVFDVMGWPEAGTESVS